MRNIRVTKIGPDFSNDSIRYRVEISGNDARVFEVLLSTTAAADETPGSPEERITQWYASGPLPKQGEIVRRGTR
jgi:hypothetical protein